MRTWILKTQTVQTDGYVFALFVMSSLLQIINSRQILPCHVQKTFIDIKLCDPSILVSNCLTGSAIPSRCGWRQHWRDCNPSHAHVFGGGREVPLSVSQCLHLLLPGPQAAESAAERHRACLQVCMRA